MKRFILFFGLVIGISFFASAQTVTPKVSKTQEKQQARISQGVASGELTRHEAKQLKRQQKHVQKEKQLAKADGVVTRRERAHIRHDQKVANRSIYKQKHDVNQRQ